jgi:hypothetical protein
LGVACGHQILRFMWQELKEYKTETDQLRLPPYEDRCRLLTLKTLNDRRKVFCAMFIRDLLEGAIDSRFLFSTMSTTVAVKSF